MNLLDLCFRPASFRCVLKKLETQARTLSPWSHARVLSNLGRAEARSAAGASEVARRLRQRAAAAAKLPPKKQFLVVADLALLAVERRRAAWAGLAKDLQSLAPRADPSHVSWLIYKLVDSKWPAARRLAVTLLKSLVSRAAKWPHRKAFALGRLVAELAPDLLPPHRALAVVNRLAGLQKMLAQVDSRQHLHYHFGLARLRLRCCCVTRARWPYRRIGSGSWPKPWPNSNAPARTIDAGCPGLFYGSAILRCA